MKIINEINSGFEKATLVINRNNEIIYHELDNKLNNPGTVARAQTWVPKSKRIYELTKTLYDYIEGIKTDLRKISSNNRGNERDVQKIFDEQKKKEGLKNKLMAYRVRLLTSDSIISKEFGQQIIEVTEKIDISVKGKDFSEYFSRNISVSEALILLARLQNNLKVVENRLLSFCNSQVVDNRFIIEYYTTYSAVIAQSSNILQPGEELTIQSGVGAFSKASHPKIFISNKQIALNEQAVAKYSTRAPMKSGKYSIPVKIKYTDQDGKMNIIEETIEYTVSDCKN